MRVLRDVVIDRTTEDELLAVSHTSALTGEELSLDLLGGGLSLELKVRVLESRPVVVNGSVRHRLRLEMLREAEPARASTDAPARGPEPTPAET